MLLYNVKNDVKPVKAKVDKQIDALLYFYPKTMRNVLNKQKYNTLSFIIVEAS